jgi:hypothetical protein
LSAAAISALICWRSLTSAFEFPWTSASFFCQNEISSTRSVSLPSSLGLLDLAQLILPRREALVAGFLPRAILLQVVAAEGLARRRRALLRVRSLAAEAAELDDRVRHLLVDARDFLAHLVIGVGHGAEPAFPHRRHEEDLHELRELDERVERGVALEGGLGDEDQRLREEAGQPWAFAAERLREIEDDGEQHVAELHGE